MWKLIKNFEEDEFRCVGGDSCCGGLGLVNPMLLGGLDSIVKHLDIKLNVLSGFRCLSENKVENDSPINNSVTITKTELYAEPGSSSHTSGLAVDITFASPDMWIQENISKLMKTIQSMCVEDKGLNIFGPFEQHDEYIHVSIVNLMQHIQKMKRPLGS